MDQTLEGKLVRWYSYTDDGRIETSGHGIVLKQVASVDDFHMYEILINGIAVLFARRDFVVVGPED